MILNFLPTKDFQKIEVSRPGYLGTPLDLNKTSIDDEADLLAAMLETLNISRVCVLALSGGGPSAYRLSVRHPEKISSIVSIAALSDRWVPPTYSKSDDFLYGTQLGKHIINFFTKIAPRNIIIGALASEGDLSSDEVQTQARFFMLNRNQREAILEIAKTMN